MAASDLSYGLFGSAQGFECSVKALIGGLGPCKRVLTGFFLENVSGKIDRKLSEKTTSQKPQKNSRKIFPNKMQMNQSRFVKIVLGSLAI